VGPGGQHRRKRAGRRVHADCLPAELFHPGRQVVEPGDVRLGHRPAGLAGEQRLDVPDRLGAADIPQEAACEQGVPAAEAAFLHD
jgi:hypothetical protein